jgi:hypothetical protein
MSSHVHPTRVRGDVKILKRGGASVLVLTCIDPRFTDMLQYFLSSQIWADYDLFTLAGSSLGVVQGIIENPSATTTNLLSWPIGKATQVSSVQPTYPNIEYGPGWKNTFVDTLSLAIALHDISEVWAFDHLDCGAYKALQLGTSEDDDPGPHIYNLSILKNNLNSLAALASGISGKTLKFKGFLMAVNGTITLEVRDPGGIEIASDNNGVVQGVVERWSWWTWFFYIFVIALLGYAIFLFISTNSSSKEVVEVVDIKPRQIVRKVK